MVVYGALRVHTYDPYVRVLLLQISADACYGAARTDTRHEVRYLPIGIVPYLRPCGLVVCPGVVLVEILIRRERPGNLVDQPLGHVVIALRVFRRHIGRTSYHLGPIGPQQHLLLHAHLVRHGENCPVSLYGGHERYAHPCVPRCGLDYCSTGPQKTLSLGILQHCNGHPVLYASPGIEGLRLCQDRGVNAFGDPVEPHKGRVPNGLEDAVIAFQSRTPVFSSDHSGYLKYAV